MPPISFATHSFPIFLRRSNIADGGAAPIIGAAVIIAVPLCPPAQLAHVNGGALNFIITEDAGDLMGTVALHAQMEDPPHHSSGFFIQEPVVLVLRVLSVAVDGMWWWAFRRCPAPDMPRIAYGCNRANTTRS